MDLSKNCIPAHIETIHIIAVCGTAMGSLACMLKEKGYKVTGSDHNVYPPMSDFLREQGIELINGFSGKNLDYKPDLVIVGNAVRRENPEALAMVQNGCCFCSMPQALNAFFAKDKVIFVASGTHGKTTTASLMAWVLYEAGLDPSFMIGGILKNFNSNYRIGKGKYIVLEGDEYDTAFFDKESKFFHFDSDITVLTSIEFDHADIFRDLEHIKNVFEKYLVQHKKESRVFAFDCDENISDIVLDKECDIQRYGKTDTSLWRLGKVQTENQVNRFEVFKGDKKLGDFQTPMPGEHNLFNIVSVIASADALGVEKAVIARALESFQGVKRRQEVRGVVDGITVMDDFAHHPTAVRETVKALKPFYPDGRLVAVFEPRTNSSRRNIFQDIYPAAFDASDIVLIREPQALQNLAESERFSSQQLVEDLKKRNIEAYYFETTDSIIQHICQTAKPGDLILIMSNGGFDNIHEKVLNLL